MLSHLLDNILAHLKVIMLQVMGRTLITSKMGVGIIHSANDIPPIWIKGQIQGFLSHFL